MQDWTFDHIHLDTIDSTNTYAKTQSGSFNKDRITCITAEHQTKGRGRFERTWVSPRGVNLYATFFFRLPLNTPNINQLATIMAESLIHLLREAGLNPEMKWPNDVLVNKKKLAGVLCEVVFQATSIEVILGLGVNLNMEAEDLAKIDQPATSLLQETGHPWERDRFLQKLEKYFVLHLQKWLNSSR